MKNLFFFALGTFWKENENCVKFDTHKRDPVMPNGKRRKNEKNNKKATKQKIGGSEDADRDLCDDGTASGNLD